MPALFLREIVDARSHRQSLLLQNVVRDLHARSAVEQEQVTSPVEPRVRYLISSATRSSILMLAG
jgi:hypothetical protein